MLEWYRPDFDHHNLMNEMDELLQLLLEVPIAQRYSYAKIFADYLNINPHTAALNELKACAEKYQLHIHSALDADNRDTWLQLLLTHLIEPQLGQHEPVFIYDFPVTQAALAKIRDDKTPVAERFEVYFKGIELANGYHELTDVNEQRLRFFKDQQHRAELGYPQIPLDENLLGALEHGLPDCAGVALGIDRLVMLAANVRAIDEVISFSWQSI